MKIFGIGYFIVFAMLLVTELPQAVLADHPALKAYLQAKLPAAHLVGFAGLTLLMLAVRWPWSRRAGVYTLIFLAGATELVQGFLPRRSSDPNDLLLNLSGIALVAVPLFFLASLKRRIPVTHHSCEGP